VVRGLPDVDAGIVDEDIDTAELTLDPLDHAVDRRLSATTAIALTPRAASPAFDLASLRTAMSAPALASRGQCQIRFRHCRL
jgi:hypothetical protein